MKYYILMCVTLNGEFIEGIIKTRTVPIVLYLNAHLTYDQALCRVF